MWIDKYVEVQVIPDVRATFGKNLSHGRNGFAFAVKATPNLSALRQVIVDILEYTVDNFEQPASMHNAVKWPLAELISEGYSDIERRHLYDANIDRVWPAPNGPLFMHNLRFRLIGGVVTEYQAIAILRLIRENWMLSGAPFTIFKSATPQAVMPPDDKVVPISPLVRAISQQRHNPNGLFVPDA